MISQSREGRRSPPPAHGTTAPRTRRRPSQRNQQIFEEVRVKGERQVDVAARYGLSQKRISAICRQIDDWHEWARHSPTFDDLAQERQRTVQLQCRYRAEQLLLAALERADAKPQEVTEVRRTEGGQTVVQRTVRELPADPVYLKLAGLLLRDIQRIDVQLGVDVKLTSQSEEADKLLAKLAGQPEEGQTDPEAASMSQPGCGVAQLARVPADYGSLATPATSFPEPEACADVPEPKGGSSYSRCSSDKRFLGPDRPPVSSGPIAVDGGRPTTYARSAEDRQAAINREKRRRFFER